MSMSTNLISAIAALALSAAMYAASAAGEGGGYEFPKLIALAMCAMGIGMLIYEFGPGRKSADTPAGGLPWGRILPGLGIFVAYVFLIGWLGFLRHLFSGVPGHCIALFARCQNTRSDRAHCWHRGRVHGNAVRCVRAATTGSVSTRNVVLRNPPPGVIERSRSRLGREEGGQNDRFRQSEPERAFEEKPMMDMLTKPARLLATAAAVTALVALPAMAQDYPDKPISVVVAYLPGGATDFQARIVTMMAQDALGQPIVIINKPGAGGQVGWNHLVSQGKEDGYDLAAYNVPHFIAQSIMFDTQYNVDNLEPIANWGADPAVLIVNKDSEFNTAEELVEFAKANPGKVTVSGAGLYVGHHIATLQLAKATGADLKYVPTKGGVDAMKYVLGGQVKAGFNNLSDAYRSRDRLKILAVADLQRNEEFLPDVPTFQELGIDVDDSSVNFRGLMTKTGVPEPVLETLSAKVPEMFNHTKSQKKMQEGGSPMRVLSREEVREMWTNRQAYLSELLAELKEQQ